MNHFRGAVNSYKLCYNDSPDALPCTSLVDVMGDSVSLVDTADSKSMFPSISGSIISDGFCHGSHCFSLVIQISNTLFVFRIKHFLYGA